MGQQATTTELATRPTAAIAATTADDFMPVMAIEQAIGRYNAVVEFTKKVMVFGRDYGAIPGTEKNKAKDGTPSVKDNVLLKPGAEKLCTLFGLSPHFEDYRVTEDWDRGLFYYAYRCTLSRNGRVLGEGIGSANSREKKYRRETRTCPSCGAAAIAKSKYPPKGSPRGTPGGWWCNPKNGGCGADFQADDASVVDQAAGLDVNAAADSVNTLQKMAQKRSLIAATLIATNASEFFTQDLDETEPPAGGRRPAADGTDEDVIDAEVEPDLADGRTFQAAVAEVAGRLGLDDKTAWTRAVYPLLVKATGKAKSADAYAAATAEQRAAALAEFGRATPEQVAAMRQPAGQGQPAAAQPAEQPKPANAWEQAGVLFEQYGARDGRTPEQLATFLAKLGDAFGVPEEMVPANDLAPLVEAAKDGRLDWETLDIKPAGQAKAAKAGKQSAGAAA